MLNRHVVYAPNHPNDNSLPHTCTIHHLEKYTWFEAYPDHTSTTLHTPWRLRPADHARLPWDHPKKGTAARHPNHGAKYIQTTIVTQTAPVIHTPPACGRGTLTQKNNLSASSIQQRLISFQMGHCLSYGFLARREGGRTTMRIHPHFTLCTRARAQPPQPSNGCLIPRPSSASPLER